MQLRASMQLPALRPPLSKLELPGQLAHEALRAAPFRRLGLPPRKLQELPWRGGPPAAKGASLSEALAGQLGRGAQASRPKAGPGAATSGEQSWFTELISPRTLVSASSLEISCGICNLLQGIRPPTSFDHFQKLTQVAKQPATKLHPKTVPN
jgi:hypothetical protein